MSTLILSEKKTKYLALKTRQLNIHFSSVKHWFTTSNRCEFSRAAATRSLSANCLLTAASDAWVPGEIVTSTYIENYFLDQMTSSKLQNFKGITPF